MNKSYSAIAGNKFTKSVLTLWILMLNVFVTLAIPCDGIHLIDISINNTPQLQCGGTGTITTTVTGYTAGKYYYWSTGDTGTNKVSITVSTPGQYTVTVVNSWGCSDSASVGVTYINGVTNSVNFSLPTSPVCGSGFMSNFTNLSSHINGWSTSWFIDGVQNYSGYYSLAQGTHTVTLAMDSAGCSFSTTQNMQVHLQPITPPITASHIDTLVGSNLTPYMCYDSNNFLHTDTGYAQYLWSTGATTSTTHVPAGCNQYSVTVTGSNGCVGVGQYGLCVDSPVVEIQVIKIVSGNATLNNVIVCPGESRMVVLPYPPFGYQWSTGETALSITVTPYNTTSYSVTAFDQYGCPSSATATVFVIDTIPVVANPGVNQMLPGCGTVTLGGNPTASGGVSPYSYSWKNGSSNVGSTQNIQISGIYTNTTYTLIVTDSLGCRDTSYATVTPELTSPLTAPVASKNGCQIYCLPDSNFTFQWGHNGYLIPGSNGSTYMPDSAGSWQALATSVSYPLCSLYTNSISMSPYAAQQICNVTLDSLNSYNLIVWDNTASQNIERFKFYKLSDVTSQYVLLGEQSADSFSVYIDTTSSPSQLSASYKISIVDSCQMESSLSPLHKTILLSSSLGVNNTVNLSWNAYQGFTYNNFEVWRSSNGGTMSLLTTVSNSTLAYIDNNPPLQAYYQIRVTNPNGCNPSRSLFDYATVRSNVVNNLGVGLPNAYEESAFQVYPNPTNGQIYLKIEPSLSETVTIRLYDAMGRIVKQIARPVKEHSSKITLDIEGAGLYFVQVVDNAGNLIGKRSIVVK